MGSILTSGLSRTYGDKKAVEDLSISIGSEIYGLLGPNGSGKTTTVNMLTTMLSPTSGEASVCGFDVKTQQRQIRELISYVPQYIAADTKLTGRENVSMYAELYGIRDKAERARKTEECLELMGLSGRADDLTRTYSGGMHRRLELAQALVHEPEVLFLDEPTVGLDVSGRRSIWEHIVKLKGTGMTVFVTTHQMEEAERYCDRVGIIRSGHLVKEGSPSDLTSALGRVVSLCSSGGLPSSLDDKVKVLKEENGEVTLIPGGSVSLEDIVSEYEKDGKTVFSSTIGKATLEDVYLTSIDDGAGDAGVFDRSQHNNMLRRT